MSSSITDHEEHAKNHDDLEELLAQVTCADCTYSEWMKVGAGLKYAGYPVEAWDKWSATDPARYDGSEGIKAHWDTFTSKGSKNGTVSGATVARICFDHGAREVDNTPLPKVPNRANAKPADTQPAPAPEQPAEPEPDYSTGRAWHAAYIDRCAAAMTEDCDGWRYLTGRGLTPDTIKRERLGWNAGTRSVVMPYGTARGDYYHIDRRIDLGTHDKGKYMKPPSKKTNGRGEPPVGDEPVFSAADLTRGEVVFVVEGGMDVYALHQLGYNAAGVISAHAYGRILDTLTEADYGGTVVVLLDDDKTGNQAATDFCDKLAAAGIEYVRGRQTPGTNDPSEALEACPDRLRAHLQGLYARATGGAYDPASVVDCIVTLADEEEAVSTGLPGLDEVLGGGLRRGLTVMGALSSLGKTTLMIQMADNIAASGRPVLFVTIEQSAKEIVSKSIVRLMHQQRQGVDGDISTDMLNSARSRATWHHRRREIMERAADKYRREIAPNMRLLQAPDRPDAAYIARHARKMADKYGAAPVIFIDYLQLMAPRSERDTDKMTADNNMRELRQMARDLSTPVFVISSINRGSYTGEMSMSAFKESGGIEYSADVALGLQVRGIKKMLTKQGRDGEDKPLYGEAKAEKANAIYEAVKAQPVRKLEVKVLKNRNGAMPDHAAAATFTAEQCHFSIPSALPKTPGNTAKS